LPCRPVHGLRGRSLRRFDGGSGGVNPAIRPTGAPCRSGYLLLTRHACPGLDTKKLSCGEMKLPVGCAVCRHDACSRQGPRSGAVATRRGHLRDPCVAGRTGDEPGSLPTTGGRATSHGTSVAQATPKLGIADQTHEYVMRATSAARSTGTRGTRFRMACRRSGRRRGVARWARQPVTAGCGEGARRGCRHCITCSKVN
jgi:hypothetical protein